MTIHKLDYKMGDSEVTKAKEYKLGELYAKRDNMRNELNASSGDTRKKEYELNKLNDKISKMETGKKLTEEVINESEDVNYKVDNEYGAEINYFGKMHYLDTPIIETLKSLQDKNVTSELSHLSDSDINDIRLVWALLKNFDFDEILEKINKIKNYDPDLDSEEENKDLESYMDYVKSKK